MASLLEQLFNHIVLPPRIPDEPDEDPQAIERILLTRMMHAVQSLQEKTGEQHAHIWVRLQRTIKSCQALNNASMDKQALKVELQHFTTESFLVMYVAEQNAAIIFRSDPSKTANVIAEVFEASFPSATVLAATHALQTDFPGQAVSLPMKDFQDQSFQSALASFLEQVSGETLSQFAARASKASVSVVEERDTTDPVIITQGLMPMLESLGVAIEVPRIKKRVRDDVNKGTNMPWRRLPLWLVMRVAIQRQLYLLCGHQIGQAYYKFLLVTILSDLLKDSTTLLAPDLVKLLQRKLCRRLAKLEIDKAAAPELYLALFESTKSSIRDIIDNAGTEVAEIWGHFKTTTTRPIPRMQLRAAYNDVQLSLTNSNRYLRQVLDIFRFGGDHVTPQSQAQIDGAIQQVSNFVDVYFNIAAKEVEAQRIGLAAADDDSSLQTCISISERIFDLINTVGLSYQGHAGQSSLLVLTLFELWTKMDLRACEACPTLNLYHPWFTPELLDVLQLDRLADMQRLTKIQAYIKQRIDGHTVSNTTIYDSPSDVKSFPVRYAQHSTAIQALQQRISEASLRSRTAKQEEYKEACKTYHEHSEKYTTGTCVCTFDSEGKRVVKGCTKCWHMRQRRRMTIGIHEDFLPRNTSEAHATVFELAIPSIITAYRNATWAILKTFCYPDTPISGQPAVMLLHDEPRLRKYARGAEHLITLASASKSFLQTHYKELKMMVEEKQVLLPMGLKFAYYDARSQIWLADFVKPLTLVALCGVSTPLTLQTLALPLSKYAKTRQHALSSYDIVANENKCPNDVSVHEFTALQKLLSGDSRRWIQILVELDSTNLNFSAESACQLISQLAAQAGPMSVNNDVLRTNHWVFKHRSFCSRLVEQIKKRLTLIQSTWRETNCLDMLINLASRLYQLSSPEDRSMALELILQARNIALGWISSLQAEMDKAQDLQTAETAAKYGFIAALLCRKTFEIYTADQVGLADSSSQATTDLENNISRTATTTDSVGTLMDEADLKIFIKASIALQQNLTVDLDKLSARTKNLLVSDAKLIFNLQTIIRDCIVDFPVCLNKVISDIMLGSNESTRLTFGPWETCEPHDRWVETVMTTSIHGLQQTIHYNIVEGHLLVAGKPLRKLPQDIRESQDVNELFGQQHLRTWISSLPGMSHRLEKRIAGCEIHFGKRDNEIVVQAMDDQHHWELIPRRVFVRDALADLPMNLIEGCVHWLDLRTQKIDIRKTTSIWQIEPNDWVIDLSSRTANRKKSQLVDRESLLFKQIAGIFRHFEDPLRIMVFQPATGNLRVDLPSLALSWYVNGKGLLQCVELRAEIDRNQDAGTWYGFESKLVLRDIVNPKRRSIITALGDLSFVKRNHHVAVRADCVADYGTFFIDPILRRLTCSPEPRLLFFKALVHAYTSFPLPDVLTQRTGAEEAMHILTSGHCHPWMPLGAFAIAILSQLQKLVPERSFYPSHKRGLQKTRWRNELTTEIQQDAYDATITDILQKSEHLRQFDHHAKNIQTNSDSKTCAALRDRAIHNRQLYQRQSCLTVGPVNDLEHTPRDRYTHSKAATMVVNMASLLRAEDFTTSMKATVADILQKWPLISGFIDQCEDTRSLGGRMSSDLSEQWGGLVQMCRKSQQRSVYATMFSILPLCFNRQVDFDTIQILVAYARVDQLSKVELPAFPSFANFEMHEVPTHVSLLKLITSSHPIMKSQPTKWNKVHNRALRELNEEYEQESRRLAGFFLQQWPSKHLSTIDFRAVRLDMTKVLDVVQPEWQRLLQNHELSNHADELQLVLNKYNATIQYGDRQPIQGTSTNIGSTSRKQLLPSLSQHLILKTARHFDSMPVNGQISSIEHNKGNNKLVSFDCAEARELATILNLFTNTNNNLRRQYGEDLKTSLDALCKQKGNTAVSQKLPTDHDLKLAITKAEERLRSCIQTLDNNLSADDDRFSWLISADLWPCTSPVSLLETLRSSTNNIFGTKMKEALIQYGIAITVLQRLYRVQYACWRYDHQKAEQEWSNIGHTNWEPLNYPDWLLMEIDSDILLREVQVEVAHATISPSSAANSVLQMNMGQGKTSCIMPICAAFLANGSQLLRLMVPKALLPSTAQIMQLNLGGLVGRSICHIPYSRKTRASGPTMELYQKLQMDLLQKCGILLTTPEHVLSFRLSGLQHLADMKHIEAKRMIETQDWLDEYCRDILDESDFTLAVKTQLIYPSGTLAIVDAAPDRWLVAEDLLLFLADHLPVVQKAYPRSIEVINRQDAYPFIHFLRTDVEDALRQHLINEVCKGRLPSLRSLRRIPVNKHTMIRSLLQAETLDVQGLRKASRLFVDKSTAYKKLLLVRGLLMNGILIICLKKRWNVQYGLNPRRDPIAVPFEAKGVPSEQAEYGHPDVSIVTTILAFFYAGLTLAQFRDSLQHVLSSDDPSAEYDRWISTCALLPGAYKHWNVINIEDEAQIQALWAHFRLNRSVLQHFLNTFVFNIHAKQFSVKLQLSGWDLPMIHDGDQKLAKTTGFSGTNDNKLMLPLTITQDDLPGLRQTNAEVLTHLLRPSNREYVPVWKDGKRLCETDLLLRLKYKGIKVLIDAGAYILEMDNRTLVQEWLKIDPIAKAAVYFAADNKAWVQYRGTQRHAPLLATSYANNLDGCLVYLDEAHTRGVDLKLPKGARGALTLALNQTKDSIAQAAMRLRLLATTQSVTFFAPPEVHQSIIDVCGLHPKQRIDSSNVLAWLMEQTCRMNEQFQNLYFAQGADFIRRTNARWNNPHFLTNEKQRKALLHVLQQPERHGLEHIYGPTRKDTATTSKVQSALLQEFAAQIQTQSDAKGAPAHDYGTALEEVEQEREVEFQVEEERQREKQECFKGLTFPGLHTSLLRFAKTGKLYHEEGESIGFENAFQTVGETDIGRKYHLRLDGSKLSITKEYMRTVKTCKTGPCDERLRPVEWILYNSNDHTAVVIIPEEAEALIPILRRQRQVPVHLITYATPVIKSMAHFNSFSFFCVPPLPKHHSVPNWLSVELQIFAGGLYLDFELYHALSNYIKDEFSGQEAVNLNAQSIINTSSQEPNLAGFVMEWMSLRRKGQDCSHTPMGYICQGRTLQADHQFFAQAEIQACTLPIYAAAFGSSPDTLNDDYNSEDDFDEYEDTLNDVGVENLTITDDVKSVDA